MEIVKINGLTKKYDNITALENINISINKGDIYGILGPNGSGKSTLINILGGLLYYNSGRCSIFNLDLKNNLNEIRKKLSIVPQEYAVYNDLKAKENVYLFAKLYGIHNTKEIVKNVLEQVNLTEYGNKYPSTFSGGMKRRLNIACALVNSPELLIMDEPTASLDPVSREYILKTINDINKKGTTIIYTSHYLEEVERICNKATVLNNGKVIISDETSKIITSYKNMECIEITINRNPNSFSNTLNEILILDGKIKVEKVSHMFKIIIYCNDSTQVLKRLLDFINTNNIRYKDISVHKRSLEEAFFEMMKNNSKKD